MDRRVSRAYVRRCNADKIEDDQRKGKLNPEAMRYGREAYRRYKKRGEQMMAKAKKCDRCGKLYEYYSGNKGFKHGERANGIILIDRDLFDNPWSRRSCDLCAECMRELESFLLDRGGR